MSEIARLLPEDEHNRRLIDNVHPSSWIPPEPAAIYNLVVVGAGTAGSSPLWARRRLEHESLW